MSKKKNKSNNVFTEINRSTPISLPEGCGVLKVDLDTDRITPRDLCVCGLMWFAVDKFGYIFCCTTNSWHVPEFVIKSYTESEILYDYFSKFVLQGEFSEVEIEENNIFYYELIHEYYFDFKKHPYHYKKINNPTNPIHFDQLPENIRKIMDSHRMTIDAHNTKYFFIPEIYQDASGTINKEARNNKLVCKPMRER